MSPHKSQDMRQTPEIRDGIPGACVCFEQG